ncbi:hypothetical protein P3W85_14610 [Cupriavidus basilensis]|uniref:Uncharacterized protein n=1 Tax=Cupriavidus basilensis TaxID=68895 RepID=A0ABT6AP57_9BURK|nr:hypothetical protein [Cupriavidus basilensis]MDF3834178.1 hypothetical protein [Cupriavidus basilensis]
MTKPSSSLGAAVDLFTVTGVGPSAGTMLSMSVAADLMHNQLPGSPVEPNSDMAVVQDSNGEPMLFSIGADRKLRLIRRDIGSAAGFSVTDLSTCFTGSVGAAAFDVSEDLDGNITLVVAMLRDEGPATNLFIASMLSNDPSCTDWRRLDLLVKPITGIDARFVAHRISMGTSDDGKAPFVTAVGALGEQQMYYQLLDPSQSASRLEFPENVPPDADAMLDIAIGYAFGQRGLWFLYKTGQSQTLECTTLATPNQGSLTYDYSPGYKQIPANLRYNCVATPTGQNTNAFNISSDVYVGTDSGIYVFCGAHANQMQLVTDRVKDARQILVKQDKDHIALWVMCGPDRLYYILGRKGPTYQWNPAILFRSSVAHIAPMRVRSRMANELFVVNSDLSVTHHWQDPATTLWQEQTLHLSGQSNLLNVPTYTTRIGMSSVGAPPLQGGCRSG